MPADRFNEYCEKLLARYKRRNTQSLTRHLDALCGFLRQKGEVVQTAFGGSVKKGTYVTGLSDVDVLLIVNESSLVNQPPAQVKRYVLETIRNRLPNNSVHAGKLAVTVKYSDKTEIQLLPAIRTKKGGVRIAQEGTRGWSKVARPDDFANKLAQVNHARNGRVVPAIKLAKAMADCFIAQKDWKLSGYHMESLAIDAFRNYRGPQDPRSMLNHLLTYSMTAVLKPITDSTGQSRHVDEYLGEGDSKGRWRASTHFGQMRAKVNLCETKREFNNLFCIEE